jgi:hypothetical protein
MESFNKLLLIALVTKSWRNYSDILRNDCNKLTETNNINWYAYYNVTWDSNVRQH